MNSQYKPNSKVQAGINWAAFATIGIGLYAVYFPEQYALWPPALEGGNGWIYFFLCCLHEARTQQWRINVLSTLKTYALAVAGIATTVLAFIAKILMSKNKRLKKERDDATAHADHVVEVITRDSEIDVQVDRHLADIVNDDELTNANDWDD